MGKCLLQNGQAVQEVAGNLRRVKDSEVDVLPAIVIGNLPIGRCAGQVKLAASGK